MSHFAVPHVIDLLGVLVGVLGVAMAFYLAFVVSPADRPLLWPYVFFGIGSFFILRHVEFFGTGAVTVTVIALLSVFAGLAVLLVLFHLLIQANGAEPPTVRIKHVVRAFEEWLFGNHH